MFVLLFFTVCAALFIGTAIRKQLLDLLLIVLGHVLTYCISRYTLDDHPRAVGRSRREKLQPSSANKRSIQQSSPLTMNAFEHSALCARSRRLSLFPRLWRFISCCVARTGEVALVFWMCLASVRDDCSQFSVGRGSSSSCCQLTQETTCVNFPQQKTGKMLTLFGGTEKKGNR